MRNLFITLLIAVTLSSFGATTTVTVTPATKYQTMEGWGVSLCWWANIAGGWQASSIDNISWKAAVDLNMNVFRFNIGGGENPNCSYGDHIRNDGGKMPGYRSIQADGQGWGTCNLTNDARQIAIMDKLASYRSDNIIEMFSNSPPYWMTKSLCAAGNTDGSENLNPNFADDYADYLATVAKSLKNRNAAWHIQYIEPFNEPLSNWWRAGGNQEGCYFYPDMQSTVLWRLWQSQQTYGIGDIKVSAPDCNTVAETQWNMWYLWNYHNGEYNGVSKINTHTYSGSWSEKASLCTDAKNGGKILWQSESGPLNWSPADGTSWWQRHYMMSYRQIEDLRNLQCSVWCDWQFLSTDEGWGMVQLRNFDPANPYQAPWYTETRGYYCRKQINSFIKAGYQIIYSSDGNTVAALKPGNTEVVVVVVNNSSTSKSYTVDLTKFQTVSSFKTYRTSGDYTSTENCTEKTTATTSEKGTISANKISYTAPKYSVTTFVAQVPGLKSARISNDGKENTQDEATMNVYYNKIRSNINVTFNGFENAQIQLIDINGRVVLQLAPTSNEVTLDASQLPDNQMYIVKMTASNGTMSKKILLQ